MSEPELEPRAVKYNVMIADASNLPMLHVNALNLRISLDEFYITLGVVQPPDQIDLSEAAGVLNAVAQPVFRFAVSRATMEQFLSVMVGQSEQQSKLVQLVNSSSEKTIKEELNRDE